MKFVVKAGADQLFSIHDKQPNEAYVNLVDRWPERVEFNKRTGELEILVRADRALIRLRPSRPIDVNKIEVEKDQILVGYQKRDLTCEGPAR